MKRETLDLCYRCLVRTLTDLEEQDGSESKREEINEAIEEIQKELEKLDRVDPGGVRR